MSEDTKQCFIICFFVSMVMLSVPISCTIQNKTQTALDIEMIKSGHVKEYDHAARSYKWVHKQ
jgi:predicted Kef-type K+ transport protein